MERRDRPPPVNPKRVRGGIKLSTKDEDPTGWLPERWLRLLAAAVDGDRLVEGRTYAAGGQTRRLDLTPGKVVASVQGRASKPYRTTLTFETLGHRAWDGVVAAMVEQAVYAAKLMAGEVPANIEDLFHPMGKRLFPLGPGEVRVSCQCAEFREDSTKWCKHMACVGYLLADRMASEPLTVFLLRGMAKEELTELLRQRRAMVGNVHGDAAVYSSHIPGLTDAPPNELSEELEGFWELGPEAARVAVPLEKPQVSKPLLRRLGPSPFEQARFPLVGLLATIYDVVSEAALSAESPLDMPGPDTSEADEPTSPEPDGAEPDAAENAAPEPAEPVVAPKPRAPVQPKKRRAKAIKRPDA
ncbi:MAG: hypothetical protein AAF138_00265 [Planctomycetota bacterium]